MKFNLSEHKSSKVQISISRESIDHYRIRGFLLGFSKSLILIQYVSNFRLDGLMVLPIEDISEIQQDRTDVFQTNLLKDIGVFENIDFNTEYRFSGWKSLFESLELAESVVSIEDETSEYPMHYIGYIKKIKNRTLKMKEFSGAGNWSSGKSTIYYEDINALQISTTYLNTYEQYLNEKT